MSATNLKCRECGSQYELDAQYVCPKCFGPLEAEYDLTHLAGEPGQLRRRIQGGPQNIWRYADFLPLAGAQPARNTANQATATRRLMVVRLPWPPGYQPAVSQACC